MKEFNATHAENLQHYSNKINRKPYVPLKPEQLKSLQDAGYLTSHKVPKITQSGRNLMHEARQRSDEDIAREVKEVEDAHRKRLAEPTNYGETS